MNLPVIADPRAEAQLEQGYAWWAANRSAEQAARWHNGFSDRILGLGDHPEQYPLAAENHAFPYEIRELRYGLGKRPTHRAIFTVRPDIAYALCIRHVAQRRMTPGDF